MEVFLSIVGLPSSDREWLIRRAEIMTRGGEPEAKGRALQEIFGYLEAWLKERREQPGDDLISRILQVQVGDRPIGHAEALSECALVLFGGLDTVAGTMAFFARYLATHPAHRRELVTHPEHIPSCHRRIAAAPFHSDRRSQVGTGRHARWRDHEGRRLRAAHLVSARSR